MIIDLVIPKMSSSAYKLLQVQMEFAADVGVLMSLNVIT